MKYTVYEGSRKGGRAANEDRVGYAYTNESLVMALADGMGGHGNGDLAAEILVREVLKTFRDLARPDLPNCQEFLLDVIYAAHAAINEHALQQRIKDPPRTTCVVCVVQAGMAWWAHVGDSRLYHFAPDRLLRRTVDHSAVQQLVDSGLLAEDQVNTHPDRNKLLNGLGGYILPNIELSQAIKLTIGDVLLMCSDGFWSYLNAGAMLSTLRAHPLREAASLLLDQAEERAEGRGDNLSVVAMRYGPDVFEDVVEDGMRTDYLDGFTTEMNWIAGREGALRDYDEIDIDQAIAEIHEALKNNDPKKEAKK
jgi:serine/threonine protein phosphatase PrpC